MNLLMGSTGFIGGHVVEYLFQQNEISKGAFRKGAHLKIMDLNGVQGVEADLLDHHSLHEAVEGVDTIYSMASPPPGATDDYRVNAEGIMNMLEVAQEMKVKTVVHLSTLDVYGFKVGEVTDSAEPRPSGAYQVSKLQADRALLEFAKRSQEPRIVIIRSARAVGSRDRILTVPLLRMVESGKVTLPESKEMSFSHPRDIAQAMYRAATGQSPSGTVYLLKSFDAAPEMLAKGIAEALGKSVVVKRQGLMSKGQLNPYASDQLKAALTIGAQESWTKLGYAPQFGLKQTCEDIAAWYRKEPWTVEQG
ncbi:MAG: NAD-dependent epimerase/dehydratase family protein [Nitrososphaerales archaeon]|nr:NAD-dependent epimerase/dehydratase family protein [Nitrososphaerales archaeon]